MDQKLIFVVFLCTVCVFFIAAEARHKPAGGDGDDHGPLYNLGKAPWLMSKKEKKAAGKQEDKTLVNDEPGNVLQLFSKGLSYISKLSDFTGTVTTLKDGVEWIIGLIDPSQNPASAADIEELKKQLEKMNAFIKAGFAQVLAGQEFLQVITIFTRHVDRLDFVTGIVVPKYLQPNGSPDPGLQEEFIKEVEGGEGPDSTEFALRQVHKMIEASGFFNSKGLYTALAEKMANCKTCGFNINGMPLFASQFNTLQAGAYGAYIAGLEAQDKKSESEDINNKMIERMTSQLGLLADAQKRFVEIAGSGHEFLKLRSSRGGCLDFQAQTSLGYHLVKCDDAPKWRVGVDGGLRHEKTPDNCVGYTSQRLSSISSLCNKEFNQWHMEFSNKDPRYFRLKSKDSLVDELCVAANIRVVDGKAKVDVEDCSSLDEEAVIEADEKNSFWEFIE